MQVSNHLLIVGNVKRLFDNGLGIKKVAQKKPLDRFLKPTFCMFE